MVSFAREISHLSNVYREQGLGPVIESNLNLSNERNFSLRPRAVVHDVDTLVYAGSRERLV